jgi:glycosyltransferase involved in cell wall biosynthesis
VRVLHATPYFAPAFTYGGPPRSVLGLCQALRRAGSEVSVVTTTANGDEELPRDVAGRDCYEGVPVSYVPRGFPRRAFRAPELAELLSTRLGSVDLVHIHGCWNAFGWATAQACRRAGVRFVLSPRGMLYPWSFANGRLRKWVSYQLAERRSLREAAFLHVTSSDEANAVAALNVPPPIVTIPNGITDDATPLRERAGEFRDRFGIPRSSFVVLFLGRLHPKKGVSLLLDAFRRVATTYSDARLVLAGGGDAGYVQTLTRAVEDLVRERRVAFIGHVNGDDRALALASADAFALTSYSENFGLAVGEAMAARLPVIVTRGCPWPSIVEWRAGWWVESTVDDVTHALDSLLSHRAAAKQMGERGHREVLRAFDWTRIGQSMLKAYETALAN